LRLDDRQLLCRYSWNWLADWAEGELFRVGVDTEDGIEVVRGSRDGWDSDADISFCSEMSNGF
jgi:hypothetical protein